jgi:hypothetical protein
MSELSRRRFIKLATQSIAATTLANPTLAALLPTEVKERPIDNGYFEIAICDSGYIYDPKFDYSECDFPTWAEFLSDRFGLTNPSQSELMDALAEFNGEEHEEDFTFDFTDTAPFDFLTSEELITNSEYWVGYHLLQNYDFRGVDIMLIEGEWPGHMFAAVQVGDPENFEAACLSIGLNVRVVSIGDNLLI